MYGQVDALDRAEGMVAFPRYRETLARFAERYGFPLDRTVAAFCALSPNQSYQQNLRSLVSVMTCSRREAVHVSTYRHCGYRAWDYLHGKVPFDTPQRGDKIRSFYHNILRPLDPHPITIDGHMFNIWNGTQLTMVSIAGDKRPTGKRYEVIAADYRAVAKEVSVLPNQLQSMLWFTWKRIHDIVYQPQLHLFRQGNQWQNLIEIETVLPYR